MKSIQLWYVPIKGYFLFAISVTAVISITAILFTACPTNTSESTDQSAVPGMPTNVTAQNTGTAGDGEVKLSWTVPSTGIKTDGKADTISSYDVYYSESEIIDVTQTGVTIFKSTTNSTITAPPVIVTGLTPGNAYYFAVVSKNTKGAGAAGTTTVSVTVSNTGDQSTVPGIPDMVQARNTGSDGDGEVELFWNAPSPGTKADGTADIIISYDIYYSEDTFTDTASFLATAIKFMPTAQITASPATITGLKAGIVYYFCVIANNTYGASEAGVVNFTTSSSALDKSSLPGTPKNIVAQNTGVPGEGQVELSWTTPDPGTKSDGTADTIISYEIFYTTDMLTLTSFTSAIPITASPVIITGLTPGESYFFAIKAVNSKGASAPGNTLSSVTVSNSGDQSTVPGMPTNVSAQNTGTPGSGEVELSWTAPSQGTLVDGTADTIISYDIYYSESEITDVAEMGVKLFRSATISTITEPPVTVTGLTPGTAYYFSVVAYNKKGAGILGMTATSISVMSQVGVNVVYVKGGTYTMGSPTDASNRADDEKQHQVTVSSFYISKYEVTHKEFAVFLNEAGVSDIGKLNGNEVIDMDDTDVSITYTSEKFSFTTSNYASSEETPVIEATWYGCLEYANWRSGKDNLTQAYSINGTSITWNRTANGYRLPTESEWEYAARGGIKSKNYLYSGSDTVGDVGWHYDNSNNSLQNVGTKNPNELDLFDMSGNVDEWCWDWYGEYPATNQSNPIGPSTGLKKVVRGGSWYDDVKYLRVARRNSNGPSNSDDVTGFRLVLPVL